MTRIGRLEKSRDPALLLRAASLTLFHRAPGFALSAPWLTRFFKSPGWFIANLLMWGSALLLRDHLTPALREKPFEYTPHLTSPLAKGGGTPSGGSSVDLGSGSKACP